MVMLVVIIAVILVGTFILLRSPPPAPVAPIGEQDASALREAVLVKLRDRLVGWTFETVPDHPLELVAVDSATERRLTLQLKRLAEEWRPLMERHLTADADELIEAFVLGATGENESGDATTGVEWARDALAVRLVKADKIPPASISRPAGPLVAVLVVRSPDGAQPAGRDDLAEWQIDEDEAFRVAHANLCTDVEDGLLMDVLDGDDKKPALVRIAMNDTLAASYALVPGLAARLSKRLGVKDTKLVLAAAGELLAIPADGVVPARENPLLEGAVGASELAWKA